MTGISAFIIFLVSRSAEVPETTLSISPDSFGAYPAVLISLDEGRMRPAPETLRGATVEGDLWVEPGDPEIAALSKGFSGSNYLGNGTVVSLSKESPKWLPSVPQEMIAPGLVFYVRSSAGQFFRVTVDGVNRDQETMTLRFGVEREE